MKNTLVAIMAAATLILSACGSNEPDQEAFEPSYYGNDKTEQCYFVDDPAETDSLKRDGLCEKDWRPAPWPEDDLAGFYPFFFYGGSGSHHYRDRHVPANRKDSYRSTIGKYESNSIFKSKVSRLSPQAKYTSSTGKIVTGDKVKANSFGGARTGGTGARPKSCGMSFTGSSVSVMAISSGGSRPSGGGGSRPASGGGTKSSNSGNKAPKTTSKC